MNVLWLSANQFGYELLKEAIIIKEVNIIGIITLAKGTKTVMYDGIENKKWKEFGIDVFEIERLDRKAELIKKLAPDLIVMCGWRQVIGKEILNIPKEGFIGFHPTLLPKGRGSAPIINSILHGWKESGVTMFRVSEGIDNGDIAGQEKFLIEKNDHSSEVYEKVINAGKKLVKKYLPLIAQKKVLWKKQDESKASEFEKPKKEDNCINPEKETLEEISRKIRAFSKPYNGAYISNKGKKLVLWRAELK
ncbi:MAG: formyltransferase family protein [Candidatus Diapherotrites archaeon]